MPKNCKALMICLAVPLAVGGLSTLLTREGMERFKTAAKPPLTPPDWLFPVVWTVLFILMGLASYLVWKSGGSRRNVRTALSIYGAQLAFNFCWSIIFFDLEMYLFAFFWLVALWGLILAVTVLFHQHSPAAAYLMVPYLLWVAFAGYLNMGVYLLNDIFS